MIICLPSVCDWLLISEWRMFAFSQSVTHDNTSTSTCINPQFGVRFRSTHSSRHYHSLQWAITIWAAIHRIECTANPCRSSFLWPEVKVMFSICCDNLSKWGPHLLGILVLRIGPLFTVQNLQQISVDLPSCGPKVEVLCSRAYKQWHEKHPTTAIAVRCLWYHALICFLIANHYICINILCHRRHAFFRRTKRSLTVIPLNVHCQQIGSYVCWCI
jgi:hypothetical protein